MAEPALSRYLDGWDDALDVGFVAEVDEGAGHPRAASRSGAAWWRFLSGPTAGYGFVDETVPEISIGIRADRRGEGNGTLLLTALISEARRRRIPGLSLSVESDNPAARWYLELGFAVVSDVDGSPTMLLRLDG